MTGHTRPSARARALASARLSAVALVAFVVIGCTAGQSPGPASPSPSHPSASDPAASSPVASSPAASGPTASSPSADAGHLSTRLMAIADAVDRWRTATDLTTARRAAEEARNLIVGPKGPLYGDADRDGTVAGASEIGLLPGLAGEAGLATAAAGVCVERDVLGGSWADPADRWAKLDAAIAAWTRSNNTFPAFPSHPQRVIGWATLTLAAPDLATAQEYGGHASLHADISLRALTGCAG